MTTAEIRRAFIDYFVSKGHTEVASSSLIPAGDPTLLFSNAGMVQFKDCFLGSDKRAYTRAVTCQKCLRISGKHNDLENVGRTARHHTFFEMLGNFSFGDYFKEDAIAYAWEFVTGVLKLPRERLWVTIYQDDDEAEKLWQKKTNVLPGRILRCGEKDNFWAMGDTGPCGPCSEIFFYLGDDVANQSEAEFRKDDGTYMEIWNLVFMQFNRETNGSLTPLPKPSVDTGMGLERVAAVMKKGGGANYDGDLLRSIIAHAEQLTGLSYLGKDYSERDPEIDTQYGVDVAMRVIADHARASSFLIADGIHPGSEGRGYVLRRLIRRACRHGRVIGFRQPFLYKVADTVIEKMGSTYPELVKSADTIRKLLKAEEEKFLVTLDTGMSVLEKEINRLEAKGSKIFPGEAAFLLHDTYGFPLDMTEDILRGKGIAVDAEGFSRSMEEQRSRSRQARSEDVELLLHRSVKATPSQFVGYEYEVFQSKVNGLFDAQGAKEVAEAGSEIALVVEQTPFYAESGGQLGDKGGISSDICSIEVLDTQKATGDTIVHICRIIEGSIRLGDSVRLVVDVNRRQRLRMHHSATHLVHLALQQVLGDHVKQAGSRVSDQSLRFDFSHFEPVSDEQVAAIEAIANKIVRENHPVVTQVLDLEEAKKSGAKALFGEKYGSSVRVVQIGPESRELCGGTHVQRSGDIGYVTVLAESGVSAGVRRIEAVAGDSAYRYISQQQSRLKSIAGLLHASEAEVVAKVERLLESQRELEKRLAKLEQQANVQRGGDLSSQVVKLADGTNVLAGVVDNADPKQLRELADDLKNRVGSICLALGSVVQGKAIILTAVSEDLTGRYNAGELVREMSKLVGGKGGGRADLAQAGGGDPLKLEAGLERFREIVS